MSLSNQICGAVDRTWLSLTGQPYRIDIRLDLRREMSAETRELLDDSLDAVYTELHATDYGPAIYEVAPLSDDTSSATYSGRVDGRPQISIAPDTWNMAESFAHELGHDAVEALDATPDAPALISETYSEAVAGLMGRAAMDRIDQPHPLTHNPFSHQYRTEWRRLQGLLDPDHRDAEEEQLAATVAAADRTDWNGMETAAASYGTIHPATTDIDDALNYTLPDSMVATHLYKATYDAKHAVEGIARTWRRMAYAPDSDAAALLDDIQKEPDNTGKLLVQNAATGHDDTEAAYPTIMKDALDTAVDWYTSTAPDVVDAADVITAFADETYGEEYDDHLDLPHTVGDQLAVELYEQGISPATLLTHADRAGHLCRDALLYTVEHASDTVTGDEYTLAPFTCAFADNIHPHA